MVGIRLQAHITTEEALVKLLSKSPPLQFVRQIRFPLEPPESQNRRFRALTLRAKGTRGTLPTNRCSNFSNQISFLDPVHCHLIAVGLAVIRVVCSEAFITHPFDNLSIDSPFWKFTFRLFK